MRHLRLALLVAVPLALLAIALWAGPPSVEKDLLALAGWLGSLITAVVWLVRWDRRRGKHLTALLGAGFGAGVVWGGFWYVLQRHRITAFADVFLTGTWLWAGITCAVLLLGVFLVHVLFDGH